MSFPSGHSSAAFAGFGFLALYLNAKLKVIDRSPDISTAGTQQQEQQSIVDRYGENRRTAHWKMVVWTLPWLVALLIAASKIRDAWHHPVDVVFGALVGTLFAHVAYRCVFRSVYDGRVNNLPRDRDEDAERSGREVR